MGEEEEGRGTSGGAAAGVTWKQRGELKWQERRRRSELEKALGTASGRAEGAPQARVCGAGARGRRNQRSPGQRQGAEGQAARPAQKGSPRVGEAPGPPLLGPPRARMGGAVRQQVSAARGARTEAAAGPGPGAAPSAPGKGRPSWTFAGLLPDLVLERFTGGRQGTAPIRPEPRPGSGRPAPTLCRGLLRSGFRRPPGSPLGRPPPAPAAQAALFPSTPGRPAQTPLATPSDPRSPPRATASPSALPSDRHLPDGPAPLPPLPAHPAWPRYLGLSKLHPLRRSAALFCRRSAAASPPGAGSIAPGGDRGLERTRVGSGFGAARPAARLTRRSPRPAPRASAGSMPRPCPAPSFIPAHSGPLSRAQTPPLTLAPPTPCPSEV